LALYSIVGAPMPLVQEAPIQASDLPDASPPALLDAQLVGMFREDECIAPSVARERVADMFDQLGLADWTIDMSANIEASRCVGAAIHAERRAVVLHMATSPEAKAAIEDVAATLLRQCMKRDEALALLTSRLESAGERDFITRTDGPVGGPLDQLDQIVAHHQKGCAIFSGVGWTEDGMRVYYLAGD
jgi:hypothetical protein